MKTGRAILPIVIVTGIASAALWTLHVVAEGASRRLYFSTGWLLVLVLALSLVTLRSAHVALRGGAFAVTGRLLWRDAFGLGLFLALAGLHLRMGLPEGVFEILLFVVLAAIGLLGIVLHGVFVALADHGRDESVQLTLRARAESILDLLLPIVLAVLPILLLHGVLSHAHGALSHLVKGGQP